MDTPIIANDDDQNVYLVVDDFGRNGRAWRETDVESADLETVVLDMLEGQYKSPVRVVASTPPKNGRKTFRPMSLRKSASTAICSCETFRSSCRIL
jgi:hypothetical protein